MALIYFAILSERYFDGTFSGIKFGTYTVQGISKSGQRVYVCWGNDWDGYYRPDKLEKFP